MQGYSPWAHQRGKNSQEVLKILRNFKDSSHLRNFLEVHERLYSFRQKLSGIITFSRIFKNSWRENSVCLWKALNICNALLVSLTCNKRDLVIWYRLHLAYELFSNLFFRKCYYLKFFCCCPQHTFTVQASV